MTRGPGYVFQLTYIETSATELFVATNLNVEEALARAVGHAASRKRGSFSAEYYAATHMG